MPNFLFVPALMPTAREGLLALFREQLAPMLQPTLSDTQLSCDLGQRFLAHLEQVHRFHLKFSRKGSWCLVHGLSLPHVGFTLQVYLPHFSGSRPNSCCPIPVPCAFGYDGLLKRGGV